MQKEKQIANEARNLGSVSGGKPYYSRRAERTIKQMASPGGVIIEHHVLRALQDQGFELDVDIDNKSVYHPDKLYVALEKYGKPCSLAFGTELYADAWRLTMKAFSGTTSLDMISSKDDLLSALRLEKASGAPLFTSKEEAFQSDYDRMIRFAKGDIAAQPCVAYHRVQHGESGPKVRLVWGYPLHMTLLEAKYARPLIDHFLTVRGVMAFGLHRHELAARLVPIENMGIRYGFDFSGFDSSIHPRLISEAFHVLKTCFKEVDDLEWERIIHYFIHTPILMPDGLVYTKHQGVPSGSYFTQLIDSIVNYFSLQYAALRLVGKPINTDRVLVLGDDCLCGVDTYIPLAKWKSTFNELGLVLNPLKSEVTRLGDAVSFLGHYWQKGLVNRDLKDIAKRMAFPERVINIDDVRLRILSRVLAFGSDAVNAHLIIVRWSRYVGPDIYGIYYRDCLTEPLLGWRELVTGDRVTLSFPKGTLDQAYIGILT